MDNEKHPGCKREPRSTKRTWVEPELKSFGKLERITMASGGKLDPPDIPVEPPPGGGVIPVGGGLLPGA